MGLDVRWFPVTIAVGATSSTIVNVGAADVISLAYGGMSAWADSTGNQTIRLQAFPSDSSAATAHSCFSGGSIVTYNVNHVVKRLETGSGENCAGFGNYNLSIATAPTQAATMYIVASRSSSG